MFSKLLEGVKVCDFTWSLVGPKTTKLFADYGAEVVKIEGRSRLDNRRATAPFKDGIPGPNRAGQFNQHSTGKLSVALNLTHPGAVEVAKRFVAWADVVVDNFAGGTISRMGFGYDELRKIKPDIIMLSSSTMGQEGPYATAPSFGVHLTALAGFNYLAGWPDRPPTGLEVYTDYIGPHFNAVVILAALDYRDRTGKGQYLDMSQYEGALQFMKPHILDYTVNGREAKRVGNHLPDASPHNAYRCLGVDRWCAIAVFTDEQWQSFVEIIGNPAWTGDPMFSTPLARKENEDALDKLVEDWTIERSAEEVMTVMQAGGVAAGLLETIEDLLDHDPQLKHRHHFWELDHPETGKHRAPGPSFILSKSPVELTRAPLLGEHNADALKRILGMSDDEIAQLVLEGAVE